MFWKTLFSGKKQNESDKESQIIETPSAYATELGGAESVSETLDPNTIATLYNRSVLLKRYIKYIVSECLRNDIIARPKPEYQNNKKSKDKAEKLNNLLAYCNKYETFREIREKYLKDYLLYGRAGIEIEPSDVHEFPTALYAVPGYCIKLNTDNSGNFKDPEKAYLIVNPSRTDEIVATFSYYSLVYLIYDKLSDRVYGESPILSIYNEIVADLNASENLQNAGSLKSGIVSVKRANRTVLQSLIEKIKQLIRVNAKVKIASISAEDAKFIDLTNATVEELVSLQKWIAQKGNVYNIPLYILGLEIKGSATAREQKDDFRALVEEIIKYEIDKLNAIILNARLGWNDVEFYCPNLATRITYERTRVAVRLVNAGIITPNEARTEYLGLKPLNDPEANKLHSKTSPKKTEE